MRFKKNIPKLFLLVAITILLVGVVSAADTNKNSTNDFKIVKQAEKVKTSATTDKITSTKNNIKKDNVTIKSANVQNIYVSSNGKGNGKTVKSPTTINKAISDIQNKGIINLVTDSASDKYNTKITINESTVKSNTKEFSIVGQKNKKIILNNPVNINGIKITLSNLHIKDSINAENAKMTIKNCTFENTKNTSISISYGNKSIITNNNFKNNTNAAILIHASDNCKIINNNFIENKAAMLIIATITSRSLTVYDRGMPSYTVTKTIAGFNLSVNNNKFINNEGDYSLIESYTDGLEVNDNIFTGNKNKILITSYGHENLTVNKNIFRDNQAELKIICSCNEKEVTVTNNIFANNTLGYDIIIDIHDAADENIIIKGNTIYYNKEKTYEMELYENNNKILDENYYFTDMALKITPNKIELSNTIKVTVTLKNKQNNLLSNQKLTITIETETYNVKTNSKGVATVYHDATELGTQPITVTYEGTDQYAPITKETKINVKKISGKFSAPKITTYYNSGKKFVIKVTNSNQDRLIYNAKVSIKLYISKSKYYHYTKYSDTSNGLIQFTKTLKPGTYKVVISCGNNGYTAKTITSQIKIIKAPLKLTAKAKTFNKSVKIKKYNIALKNNRNQPMKTLPVALKVNGKNYKAKTNAKGVATFQIKNLNNKGKYTATITYNGDQNYNKVTQKVKITIK